MTGHTEVDTMRSMETAKIFSPKIYKASRQIAAQHKSCAFCSERIRVGMPVQFVDGNAEHASCAQARANHPMKCGHHVPMDQDCDTCNYENMISDTTNV